MLSPILAGREFSPLDIPGCGLYLEGDKGLTVVSSKIFAWADQSGHIRNFSQSNAAIRPSLGTLNGYTALDFTDGPYLQLTNDGLLRNLPGYTIIIVHRPDTLTSCRVLFSAANSTSNGWRIRVSTHYDAYSQIDGVETDDGVMGQAAAGTGLTGAQLWLVTMDFSEDRGKLYRNGSLLVNQYWASWADVTVCSDTDSPLTWIGGGVFNGRYDGLIAVVACWQRLLTTEERTYLTRGFGRKYGITVA